MHKNMQRNVKLFLPPNAATDASTDDSDEQENPADARTTRDSAVIPRWPSAAILDIIKPEIAQFDLQTPKTLA